MHCRVALAPCANVLLACWNVAGRVRALEAEAQALLAIGEVGVRACRYEHGRREQGLSDHSALIAELDCG